MKHETNGTSRKHSIRHAVVLTGLLLLSFAMLTACRDGSDPAETDAATTDHTTMETTADSTDSSVITEADTVGKTDTDTEAEATTETTTETEAEISAETETDTGLDTSAGTESETTGETTPEDVTLGEVDTLPPPPETETEFVPGSLIGDGVTTAGPFAVFSKLGGVYTDTDFSIELTVPEGYTVRYTTDGSLPTKRSPSYAAPITFSQTAGNAKVIRAACFNADGMREGQVITQTYVTVKSTDALSYTVMISTDESNLNDMYSDVHAKIERAAHVEIVALDGTRVVSQDVGLRLFGGSSRTLQQKSFKIIARKDGHFGTDTPYVGAGTFTYPFFPERIVQAGKNAGQVLTKFDGLILRNGGNDSILASAADKMDPCLLRDGIANEFVNRYAPHVGASLQHFASVYLNGEYYGILELRENQNEDYVKRIWGVLDDDVVVIKSELDTNRRCDNNCGNCRFCGIWFFYETDENAAAQKEMADWIALCKKAADAVNADEATYRKIFEELDAKIDLENVKEYLAMSCYLCNKDWPYNNVRLWRYTGAPIDGVAITDGKFRFATRDMDMSFARYSSPHILPDLDSRADVDMFEWVLGNYVGTYGDQPYADALYLQGLFSFLLRDDTFRGEFADYCRTLVSDEAVAYLMALYEDTYDQVRPLMPAHLKCWKNCIPGDYNLRAWQNAAGRVKTFIEDRPAEFLKQIDKMLSMYE